VTDGALISRRSGWSGCVNSLRLNGSLRHRRSRYSTAASAADLRHRRQRASMVSVVSRRSDAIRSSRCSRSLITRLLCGVPQGSVLGPLLFILNTFDLIQLIEGNGLGPHLYADDTLVSGSSRPSNVSAFLSSISDCLRDVASWMKSNSLQLNSSKAEVMKTSAPAPSTCVGVISRRRDGWSGDVRPWPWHLHRRRPQHEIGLPTYLVRRLQSVLNASARIIFLLRRSDHITDALASYTGCVSRSASSSILPCWRIKFCMGLHHVTWVRSSVCLICRVGVASALPAPIAWSYRHSNCLLLAVEHLMLLLLEHGTVCRRMWHRYQHCPRFVKDWKRICFINLILTLFLNLVILPSPHRGFEVALLLRPLKQIMVNWLIDWLRWIDWFSFINPKTPLE